VTAFINIDLAPWELGGAPEHCIHELRRPGPEGEVYELITGSGAREPKPPRGRVLRGPSERFLILHKELDPDDEEITRTRKVRRATSRRSTRRSSSALLRAGPCPGRAQVTYETAVPAPCART